VRAARGRGEHEVLANEEGVEADGAELPQVLVGAQAGFADGEAIVRDVLDQIVRVARVPRGFLGRDCSHRGMPRTGRNRPRGSELFKRVDFARALHARVAGPESDSTPVIEYRQERSAIRRNCRRHSARCLSHTCQGQKIESLRQRAGRRFCRASRRLQRAVESNSSS